MIGRNWRRRMAPLKQPLDSPSIQLIRVLLIHNSFYKCSRQISGEGYAGKGSDCFVPGYRRRAGRRAGAGGAGPTRLRHGGAGRQGGGRKTRAGGEAGGGVRPSFRALGLALPPQRITVNLSPADLAKEGSHYDLPIALGLLAAMGVIPRDSI